MWNDAEKQDALSNIKDAWVDISNACVAWGFDECDEFNAVDTALDDLLTALREVPAVEPKSERPMTTIRVDTHGMDATAVQAALDAYVQDAVDRNLQNEK